MELDEEFLDRTKGDLRGRSRKYLKLICDELELPKEAEEKAWEYLQKTDSVIWGVRSWVAGAVYLASTASGCHRTEREVAEVAHTTEVTVRNKSHAIVQESPELKELMWKSFFLCPYCGKELVGSTGLNHHIRSIHPEEFEELVEKYDYKEMFWREEGDLTFREIMEKEGIQKV